MQFFSFIGFIRAVFLLHSIRFLLLFDVKSEFTTMAQASYSLLHLRQAGDAEACLHTRWGRAADAADHLQASGSKPVAAGAAVDEPQLLPLAVPAAPGLPARATSQEQPSPAVMRPAAVTCYDRPARRALPLL